MRPWTALAAAAREPRGAWGVLEAALGGRPLRARQRLLALAGAEHRLDLPPAWRAAIDGRDAPEPGLAVLTPEEVRAGTVPDDAAAILILPRGHRLVPGAARAVAAAFADPGVQALYGDAVTVGTGAPRPLLRPAFDPDYLTACDHVGPVAAFRREALVGLDAVSVAESLLALARAHGEGAVRHLSMVLSVGPAPAIPPVREEKPGLWPGAAPLVTAIVPTRDRLDLLRPCLESLRTRTAWDALEILVIDHESREPQTRAYLDDLAHDGAIRVMPWRGPFDFAAMNNDAARLARGKLLAFLNNDVEAFRPDWLARMAREALRPEVGAVGAKLLDVRGRIQHGGIVLGTGGGLATHAHRFFPADAPGYGGRLLHTHRVSAVTAACLVVEARKFAAVGGFDAARFAVDFNDVDLCLRLDEAGYRTLMVPGAVLHHRESASRRPSEAARARHAAEVAALRERWPDRLAQDPWYHPGFDPDLGTYVRLRREPPPAALR